MEKLLAVCLTLATCGVVLVSSISFEEDVTLTAKEKEALGKFKLLAIPKIPKSSYIQNYVGDDLYFIHWLRATRLDVQAAQDKFLKHLKWRETEKIDKINDDGFDWVQFDKEYPVFINDTVDREGRPLGEMWYGDWDVRQGVLAGRSPQLLRGMIRFSEMMCRRLFKARAEGKQVSQAVSLIDMDGFNLRQHACPSCIPILIQMTTLFENHYQYLYDRIFVVNVPASFQVLQRLLQPILSESSAKALKILGDKKEWLKVLDERVGKNQRSVRFGGTIVRE